MTSAILTTPPFPRCRREVVMAYERATFEMVTASGYVTWPATIVGSFAVHTYPTQGWRVSHAATGFGIPSLYPRTKREAVAAALAMEQAADWTKVVRSNDPSSPIMGVPKEKLKAAVLAGKEAISSPSLETTHER